MMRSVGTYEQGAADIVEFMDVGLDELGVGSFDELTQRLVLFDPTTTAAPGVVAWGTIVQGSGLLCAFPRFRQLARSCAA